MLKINTCPTISYTSQPEKSITKITQIENKNSNNKLLLVGMTALGILSVGGLLLNTKCVSKNIKTNLPNTMREVIQNINEDAIKTKQAVNDLASGSLFKQENKASEEYFDSIESYHDIIDKNWTQWQRDCDSLKYNFGHKALFEHFALSPKQLSDVHRDIESLHMSLLKYLQTQNSEYEDLIPKLASKILKDGALEELTKINPKNIRNDIIDDKEQWTKFWRKNFRDKDRPTSNVEKLKEILAIL